MLSRVPCSSLSCCGQARDTSRYESYILRSHVRLGAPLAVGDWYHGGNASAFLNSDDRWDDQRLRVMSRYLRPAEAHLREVAAAWKAEASAQGAPPNSVDLLFAQSWLYNEEYTGIILSDLMFTLGSVGCVSDAHQLPHTHTRCLSALAPHASHSALAAHASHSARAL